MQQLYLIRKYGLFVIFGLVIVGGIIFMNKKTEKTLDVKNIALETENSESSITGEMPENDEKETDVQPEELIVDIKGQVLDPGVYTLEAAARVHDVIELAGGFLEEADENQINLAERVYDEMYIYIPKIGETELPVTDVDTGNKSADKDAIRINQATASELETLDGIGPGKAQAIIDYMEENGPLASVDDLLEISGIGEKTLEKFKEQIIVP